MEDLAVASNPSSPAGAADAELEASDFGELELEEEPARDDGDEVEPPAAEELLHDMMELEEPARDAAAAPRAVAAIH
eukprot:10581653-Lingulodinium_polyedra.AAC.1